ncbi:hypothetical protein ACFQZ4_44270 [Catellatospora coxensis]
MARLAVATVAAASVLASAAPAPAQAAASSLTWKSDEVSVDDNPGTGSSWGWVWNGSNDGWDAGLHVKFTDGSYADVTATTLYGSDSAAWWQNRKVEWYQACKFSDNVRYHCSMVKYA